MCQCFASWLIFNCSPLARCFETNKQKKSTKQGHHKDDKSQNKQEFSSRPRDMQSNKMQQNIRATQEHSNGYQHSAQITAHANMKQPATV